MLIVWDYFGVMAQDTFWYRSAHIEAGMHHEEYVEELHREMNLGEITWEQYCQAVADDIGVPYEKVYERYRHHDIKQQCVLAIKALPDHTHVLLSNASEPYLLGVMDELGLHALFSEVFVSSVIGYIKPDPRAFLHVLAATKWAAREAIMIDDSATNIDAARQVGMNGIIFEPHKHILSEIHKVLASNS